MDIYDKLYSMNTLWGIWHYTERFRITYVSQGWLIVWDHQQIPPARYDCKSSKHREACLSAEDTLRRLTSS